MTTLTRTKSETIPTLDNDLAASVPTPFPAFARPEPARVATSFLLSQPQQQDPTQQLIDVTVDVSQQPTLPVDLAAAEAAQPANAWVGGSSFRRCLGSFPRFAGVPSAFYYCYLLGKRPTHRGNCRTKRESGIFLHVGLVQRKTQGVYIMDRLLAGSFLRLRTDYKHPAADLVSRTHTKIRDFNNPLLGRWRFHYHPS